MKFLQHEDSVVSLRFKYLAGGVETGHFETVEVSVADKAEAEHKLNQALQKIEEDPQFYDEPGTWEQLGLLQGWINNNAPELQNTPAYTQLQEYYNQADSQSVVEPSTYDNDREIPLSDIFPEFSRSKETAVFGNELNTLKLDTEGQAAAVELTVDRFALAREIAANTPAEVARVEDLEAGRESISVAEKQAGTEAAPKELIRSAPVAVASILQELERDTATRFGASAFAGFDADTASA